MLVLPEPLVRELIGCPSGGCERRDPIPYSFWNRMRIAARSTMGRHLQPLVSRFPTGLAKVGHAAWAAAQ